MKRVVPILLSIVLALLLFLSFPVNRSSATQIAENGKLRVDGTEYDIRIMNQEFDKNAYISLRDLARALNGTSKEISVNLTSVDGEDAVVIKSGSYGSVGGENVPYDEEEMAESDWVLKNSIKRYKVYINDRECRIYGIWTKNAEGNPDFFMSTGELAIFLDMDMEYDNGVINIDTSGNCYLDIDTLSSDGFFYMSDCVLVGDATTGEIYYSQDADAMVSIASTTKLMTYFVLMDAVTNGEVSLNDTVTFSENAERESLTENGVVRLTAGENAPIMDVIKAMLIKSSNECALAIAEHVAGSEEAFVERMNEKARALGLSDEVHFYNPHGLPHYDDNEVFSSKLQNRMSANDMFVLCTELLSVYPQITEITSIKKTSLSSLSTDIENTNLLLYNVPEVVGLKTGTTTKAGSCLVSAAEVTDDEGLTHYIVAIEYGAETQLTQSYASLVLIKYGMQEFYERLSGSSEDDKNKLPENAEELIRAVINTAKKHH